MNTNLANNPTAPPSILTALRAGFDAISNQIGILIFPILIDILIWLGPHLRLKNLIVGFFDRLSQYSGLSDSASGELIGFNFDLIDQFSNRMNMMSLLRTFPVGIPSLMAGRQPVETPITEPIIWSITSIGALIFIGIALLLVGLAAGTFYYQFVAQIAFRESMDWRKAIHEFPRAFGQIIVLVLSLIGLIVVISIPASCLMSLMALSGLSIGQFVVFVFFGLLIWFLFPLILTPQAIFLRKSNVISALKNSLRVTRMTLPGTAMLFAVILLTSEGLDILWRIPEENSWLNFLSIFGHAFITTSLLTATFIYYQDADNWVQSVIKKLMLSQTTK